MARHADAVPGPGVRIVAAVPLLRRPRARARASKWRAGRAEFLAQFPSVADPAITACAGRPAADRRHSRAAVLDLRERETHAAAVALHRDLLRLRRETAAFRAQAARGVDGAVLGAGGVRAPLLRRPARASRMTRQTQGSGDRLLLVNLGRDLDLDAGARAAARAAGRMPLGGRVVERAPELRRRRAPRRSKTRTRGWHLPGHAAIVLRPCRRHARRSRRHTLRAGQAAMMPSPLSCTTAPARAERMPLLRRMPWPGAAAAASRNALSTREWLVTNGLGGYASGTVSGVMTRRYHGLLVAALPAPLGRVVMLNHLAEHLRLPDGRRIALGGEERVGSSPELHGAQYLREFRLEAGLPVWRFDVGGCDLEKRLLLPHRRTPSTSRYRLLSGGGRCGWSSVPSCTSGTRSAGQPAARRSPTPSPSSRIGTRSPATALPPLRLLICGERRLASRCSRTACGRCSIAWRRSRGYESAGDWWSPGLLPRVARAATPTARSSPPPSRGRRSGRSRPTPRWLREQRAPRAAARLAPAAARERHAGRARAGGRPVHHHAGRPRSRTPPARAPPATRCARSSPATTGSPTGAATR